MTLLIQQACIIDPRSSHHQKIRDILVHDGIIRNIAETISDSADSTIHLGNCHLSPGWVDVFAHFDDPGFEFKETLETGTLAAAAGGYTDVFIIPNTKPPLDQKAQVEYVLQKSRLLAARVWPLGAVTRNLDGKELAEMYDMKASGAVAFSDGLRPIQSSGLLLKALQYIKAFKGVLVQIPDDRSLGTQGLMHEGIISTRLGLPGMPIISEELAVARDIKLARYAESRIHFTGVTSQKSLEYIQRGKDSGLAVTCSVTPYHLNFCDEDLLGYDTNLKVYPPLRSRSDMEALRQGVSRGAVDCIASHHLPHEYDSKIVEFEHAQFGMTGLETAYALVRKALPNLDSSRLVELFSSNPRKIFGLEDPVIEVGSPALLSLFDPDRDWQVLADQIFSKSRNTPLMSAPLKGRPLGTIRGAQIWLNPFLT